MSAASDKFEKDVTKAIGSNPNTKAEQGRDVKFSDVKVTRNGIKSWVEVKMSHSDNLSNPRFFYMDKKWQTSYTTPAATSTLELLNSSPQTNKFIKNISKFSGIPENYIIIGTNKSHLKLPGCVPLHIMKSYFSQSGINRYISIQLDIDIGELVTKHYIKGKAEPACYLQAGNDFYMIGTTNPFKLDTKIPKLAGIGDLKVRVSTRSEFYEVQAEIKIKHFKPISSNYSVIDAKKINPFL